MKIRVDVMLKKGVLDPQGKAIGHALENLGFSGVGEVRVGKVIELDIAANDANKAQETAKEMAKKLLANQVIEDFRVSVILELATNRLPRRPSVASCVFFLNQSFDNDKSTEPFAFCCFGRRAVHRRMRRHRRNSGK